VTGRLSDGRFFEIAHIGSGLLYIGPRPRKLSLGEWCSDLAGLGVSYTVSFIGDDEVEDYGLAGEEAGLNAQNIDFTHFPIIDYGAPKRPGYRDLVRDIYEQMKSGKSVFAHCAGGVGRAGTFASCLLVADGMDADEAMQLVSKQRGANAPETEGQRAFVRNFVP